MSVFLDWFDPMDHFKPHAKVISDFAAAHPVVMPAKKVITLPYKTSEYYENTLEKFMTLYQQWKGVI